MAFAAGRSSVRVAGTPATPPRPPGLEQRLAQARSLIEGWGSHPRDCGSIPGGRNPRPGTVAGEEGSSRGGVAAGTQPAERTATAARFARGRREREGQVVLERVESHAVDHACGLHQRSADLVVADGGGGIRLPPAPLGRPCLEEQHRASEADRRRAVSRKRAVATAEALEVDGEDADLRSHSNCSRYRRPSRPSLPKKWHSAAAPRSRLEIWVTR
jgi:hypothetical protein